MEYPNNAQQEIQKGGFHWGLIYKWIPLNATQRALGITSPQAYVHCSIVGVRIYFWFYILSRFKRTFIIYLSSIKISSIKIKVL